MNYLKELEDIWYDLKGNIIKPIDYDALIQKLKENQEIAENDQGKELCSVPSQLLREKSINIENHENQDNYSIINQSQIERSCQKCEDNLQDVRNKSDNQYFLMNVMEKNKRSYRRCVSQNLREINMEQRQHQNQNSLKEEKINSNVLAEVQSSVDAPKPQQLQDQMITLEQLISEFNSSLSLLNRYLKWLKDLEQQFLRNLCSWYWRLHGLEISHVNRETKELRTRLRSHSLLRTTLQEISKHLRQLQLSLTKEQENFSKQARQLRQQENGKTDDYFFLEQQELNQIELSHSPYHPRNSYYDMLQTLPAHFTNILRHLRSIQISERKEFKKWNIYECSQEGKQSILNCLQSQFPARINTNERSFKELSTSKSKQKIFSNLPHCSFFSNYLPNYLTKWSFDGQVLVTVSQSASSANTQIIQIMQFPLLSKEESACIVNNIASLEIIETLHIASKRVNDVSLSNSEDYLGVALAEGYLLLIKRQPKSINLNVNESVMNKITQNPIEINKISVSSPTCDQQQRLIGPDSQISPTNCDRVACKIKGNYKEIEFILSRNLICCLSAGSSQHCLIFDYSQNKPVIQISMPSLCLTQERQQFLQGPNKYQQTNQLSNEFRIMSIYSGLLYPTVILHTSTSLIRCNLNILVSSSHRTNHSRIVFEEEFSFAIPSPDESFLLLVSLKQIVLKQRKDQGNTEINDQDVDNSSSWQLKWQYSQNQTDKAKQFEFSNDNSELYFLYDHRLVVLHIRFLHYYKSTDSNYIKESKGTHSLESTQYLTELFQDKSIKLNNFFISADNSLIHLLTDTESIITLQKADRPRMF